MSVVTLMQSTWTVGAQIDSGGFGAVYEGSGPDGQKVALKFVPKAPGAERELLFVDLGDARNVVPILDSGETDTHYVLVMPFATQSLKTYIMQSAPLSRADALSILQDVALALADLLERDVVHRDLKPGNVLLLDGRWCLSDFGISRYAEKTTAPDTHKYALSAAYAAPERWRLERATPATDVYSFGVIAYELLDGELPFPGPSWDDFRDQHLSANVPDLKSGGAALAALIGECLYKAPQTRPRADALVARLVKLAEQTPSRGIARLQAADHAEVKRRSETTRRESEARSARERRDEIVRIALQAHTRIAEELFQVVIDNAPTAVRPPSTTDAPGRAWDIALGPGRLAVPGVNTVAPGALAAYGKAAPFDVVAYSSVSALMQSPDRTAYRGRSHSLWYCDAKVEGNYQWYETAFMSLGLAGGPPPEVHPFALDPDRNEAGEAVAPVMGMMQLAWPFEALVPGDLDDFIERWTEWLADAAEGRLARPSYMPERDVQNSHRR